MQSFLGLYTNHNYLSGVVRKLESSLEWKWPFTVEVFNVYLNEVGWKYFEYLLQILVPFKHCTWIKIEPFL